MPVDVLNCSYLLQIWRVAPTPQGDKYQYTHFAHKINSFDTAPKKLLASDSRLRPDRYALEKGDMSKSGAEKSRYFPLSSTLLYDCNCNLERPVCLPSVLTSPLSFSANFQAWGTTESWEKNSRGQGRAIYSKMVQHDRCGCSYTMGWPGNLWIQRQIHRPPGCHRQLQCHRRDRCHVNRVQPMAIW